MNLTENELVNEGPEFDLTIGTYHVSGTARGKLTRDQRAYLVDYLGGCIEIFRDEELDVIHAMSHRALYDMNAVDQKRPPGSFREMPPEREALSNSAAE